MKCTKYFFVFFGYQHNFNFSILSFLNCIENKESCLQLLSIRRRTSYRAITKIIMSDQQSSLSSNFSAWVMILPRNFLRSSMQIFLSSISSSVSSKKSYSVLSSYQTKTSVPARLLSPPWLVSRSCSYSFVSGSSSPN